MNKIEIAKEYIDMHNSIISDEYESSSNEELEDVYNNMIAGEYGEVRKVEGYDNEYEIEIKGTDTNSGNPKIFTFEKAE